MPRRTRKQLVGKIENEDQAIREDELRMLRRELRWSWRRRAELTDHMPSVAA